MNPQNNTPALNPSIKTNSKVNEFGEIINPTNQDVSTFNSNFSTYTPSAVSANSLQPNAGLNFANNSTVDTSGADIVQGANQGTTQFDTDYQRMLDLQQTPTTDQNALNQSLQALVGAENALGGQGQAQIDKEAQLGLPTMNKERASNQGLIKTGIAEYTALKNEFDALSADVEAGAGRKGLTTRAVMGQQAAIERQKLARLNSKASEIGILQAKDLALAGDIEAAQNTANRAVDLLYKDREAAYTNKLNQYNRNKDIIDKYDSKRSKALEYALKKEETAIAEEKQNKKDANAYLINAIQGNAPKSLTDQAQKLINNGASATDIAKVLGNYSLSYSERIDQQYKLTQMSKLNFEMSQARTKEAKEALAVKQAAQAQLPKVKEELDLINNLLSNTLGLEKSAALTGLGRFKQLLTPKVSLEKPSLLGSAKGLLTGGLPGAIAGSGSVNVSSPVKNLEAKRDFIGTVSQLTSTGTLNTLIEAKKNGATFGALSDRELGIIAASFSKLTSPEWVVRDKNGAIKGFKVSDDLVEAELQKLQSLHLIYINHLEES